MPITDDDDVTETEVELIQKKLNMGNAIKLDTTLNAGYYRVEVKNLDIMPRVVVPATWSMLLKSHRGDVVKTVTDSPIGNRGHAVLSRGSQDLPAEIFTAFRVGDHDAPMLCQIKVSGKVLLGGVLLSMRLVQIHRRDRPESTSVTSGADEAEMADAALQNTPVGPWGADPTDHSPPPPEPVGTQTGSPEYGSLVDGLTSFVKHTMESFSLPAAAPALVPGAPVPDQEPSVALDPPTTPGNGGAGVPPSPKTVLATQATLSGKLGAFASGSAFTKSKDKDKGKGSTTSVGGGRERGDSKESVDEEDEGEVAEETVTWEEHIKLPKGDTISRCVPRLGRGHYRIRIVSEMTDLIRHLSDVTVKLSVVMNDKKQTEVKKMKTTTGLSMDYVIRVPSFKDNGKAVNGYLNLKFKSQAMFLPQTFHVIVTQLPPGAKVTTDDDLMLFDQFFKVASGLMALCVFKFIFDVLSLRLFYLPIGWGLYVPITIHGILFLAVSAWFLKHIAQSKQFVMSKTKKWRKFVREMKEVQNLKELKLAAKKGTSFYDKLKEIKGAVVKIQEEQEEQKARKASDPDGGGNYSDSD